MKPRDGIDQRRLALAAISGLLVGLGCGGGRAEEAAGIKSAHFTEPASSAASPVDHERGEKMSCSPEMKGMTSGPQITR